MFVCRDEDRDKCSDHLKSSSSEESVRKRRPSGNISINSQLSIFSQSSTATTEQPDHAAIAVASSASATANTSTASITAPSTKPTASNPVAIAQQSTADSTKTIVIPQKVNSIVVAANGAAGGGGSAATETSDFHYDTVDNVKLKYNYHDEPHSFENSMEFLEDFNHFQFEVLETTV